MGENGGGKDARKDEEGVATGKGFASTRDVNGGVVCIRQGGFNPMAAIAST
jgi:hypothetical protein